MLERQAPVLLGDKEQGVRGPAALARTEGHQHVAVVVSLRVRGLLARRVIVAAAREAEHGAGSDKLAQVRDAVRCRGFVGRVADRRRVETSGPQL